MNIKVNGKNVKIGKNAAETQRNIVAAQDPAATKFANDAWRAWLTKVASIQQNAN
jgi:hypothetical protein